MPLYWGANCTTELGSVVRLVHMPWYNVQSHTDSPILIPALAGTNPPNLFFCSLFYPKPPTLWNGVSCFWRNSGPGKQCCIGEEGQVPQVPKLFKWRCMKCADTEPGAITESATQLLKPCHFCETVIKLMGFYWVLYCIYTGEWVGMGRGWEGGQHWSGREQEKVSYLGTWHEITRLLCFPRTVVVLEEWLRLCLLNPIDAWWGVHVPRGKGTPVEVGCVCWASQPLLPGTH